MKNFRNFSSREVSFSTGKNIIIGKNGHGKTNILEALAIPVGSLVESVGEYLVKRGESTLFIQYQLDSGDYSYSFDRSSNKKRYFAGKNPCSRPKVIAGYPHVVSFHPLVMNMMYLSPSERRDFLDQVLMQSFPTYKKTLSTYKKILTSRNRVLKNIFEKKSSHGELDFWDQAFIKTAIEMYKARRELSTFLGENIGDLEKYFFGKVQNIEFRYISKINISDIQNSLENYIKNNKDKEVLARRTCIGPHLDDFEILLDDTPLIHFASRGEVKSSILALKFLETGFIEKHSSKQNILFLIDDLLSELDAEHRDMLWSHIGERQCVISAIEDSGVEGNKIFI